MPIDKEKVAQIIEINNLLQEVAQLVDQRQKRRITMQPREDMEKKIDTSVCLIDSNDGRNVEAKAKYMLICRLDFVDLAISFS